MLDAIIELERVAKEEEEETVVELRAASSCIRCRGERLIRDLDLSLPDVVAPMLAAAVVVVAVVEADNGNDAGTRPPIVDC
jgi:hypothetical protein